MENNYILKNRVWFMESNYIYKNGTWYVEENGELQELILTTEEDCMYGAY